VYGGGQQRGISTAGAAVAGGLRISSGVGCAADCFNAARLWWVPVAETPELGLVAAIGRPKGDGCRPHVGVYVQG
jgi:hypothetical protein